jgi:hypothetical protein
MRLFRSLVLSGSAAALAGAVTCAAGSPPPAAAGPAHAVKAAAHTPSARFVTAARAALSRYLSHSHPAIELVRPGARASDGISKLRSFNWSGYADGSVHSGRVKRGTFTRVSGNWTVPAVSCGAEDQISSNWVGLDGLSDATVEQAGTVSWCYQDTAMYFTWFEMFPRALVEVHSALRAGDKISASVSHNGARYTLRLTDSTTPKASFVRRARCAARKCHDTSAEWIVERPAFTTTGIAPLANFASTGFARESQTHSRRTGKISGFRSVLKINMLDSRGVYTLATAGPLTGGNSFTDTWHNSY